MPDEIKPDQIIALLLPRIQATVSAAVKGKLADEMMSLKDTMSHELWDKVAAEIGKQMNIPEDIIKKLQSIDDIVTENKEIVDSTIKNMITTVEEFKDRLKNVDLNATLTMSYGELRKIRIKAAMSWATISFFLGLFIGFVCYPLIGLLG